jgi:hypothetical protein
MKTAALLALLVALAAFPVHAEEVFGRVDAVYYEAARGVLVDAKLHRRASGPRWADVDVGGRKVLARVPDDMRLSTGDRIAVRLGDPKSSQLAAILPSTTVSRVIAPDPNASIGR